MLLPVFTLEWMQHEAIETSPYNVVCLLLALVSSAILGVMRGLFIRPNPYRAASPITNDDIDTEQFLHKARGMSWSWLILCLILTREFSFIESFAFWCIYGSLSLFVSTALTAFSAHLSFRSLLCETVWVAIFCCCYFFVVPQYTIARSIPIFPACHWPQKLQ